MVDSGALEGLVICLEEFDPGVKEASAWAMGYIARHNGGILMLVYIHNCLYTYTYVDLVSRDQTTPLLLFGQQNKVWRSSTGRVQLVTIVLSVKK